MMLPTTDTERKALKKRSNALARENNKMAKELGYPRGVKQMKEEGVI